MESFPSWLSFLLLPVEQQDQNIRNWAELPQDVLLVILQKLVIFKYYNRFACVCRSWKSVALEYLKRYAPMGSPCLIVPAPGITSTSKSRRLLAHPVGKDIAKEEDFLPQTGVRIEDMYIGSYQGWLVMLKDEMHMYLLNPFSDTRIELSNISLVEICSITVYSVGNQTFTLKSPSGSFCVSKVILFLSTIPTASNCSVLLIYGYKKLFFGKVWDVGSWPSQKRRVKPRIMKCNTRRQKKKRINGGWNFIDDEALGDDIDKYSKFYMDAIYFKGQFYVVSARGEIFVCDLTVSKPTLTKIYGNGFRTNALIHRVRVLLHDPQLLWYLVECRGQLFRILQIGKCCNEEEDHLVKKDPSTLVDTLYCGVYSSYCFEVCKLDSSRGSKPSWIEVDNFEGDAVFLCRNQSFSLSNPHEFGYKGNRIYFTDHRSINIGMGVFNLEDSTLEPLYQTNSRFILPSAIWVIPKP